jgi:hypothetical protein
MPSGNGSSGGHASGRGAPLEPTRPTSQVRFGSRVHEAETPRHACRRRRAAESACFRASVRVAPARPSRRGGRTSPDEGQPTRPPVPLGPSGRDVFSVPEQSVFSRLRVRWTGVEPVTPRLKTWCSTSELPRPGPAPVPNPYTEHTLPTVRRRGKARRGPDGASRLRGPWYLAHAMERRQARPTCSRGTRLSGR